MRRAADRSGDEVCLAPAMAGIMRFGPLALLSTLNVATALMYPPPPPLGGSPCEKRQFAPLRHRPCAKKRQMATPDGLLFGEPGACGSSLTVNEDTSGSSSLLMWAKGQWAPFRQLPLAKNTQGVCARPGLEVPAARQRKVDSSGW